jgi:hypothetical protein
MENWNKFVNEEEDDLPILEEGWKEVFAGLLATTAIAWSPPSAAADVLNVPVDGDTITMTSADLDKAANIAADTKGANAAADPLRKLADAPGSIDIGALPDNYQDLLTIVAQTKHDHQTQGPDVQSSTSVSQYGGTNAPLMVGTQLLPKLRTAVGWTPEVIKQIQSMQGDVPGLQDVDFNTMGPEDYEYIMGQFLEANPKFKHLFDSGDTGDTGDTGGSAAGSDAPTGGFLRARRNASK